VRLITSPLGLMIALAAGGCGSSTLRVPDASSDGGPFCAHALGADCAASSSPAGYCSLDMAVQSACGPCGSGQGCDQVALVRGTRYTYLQSLGIDTASVYVYDANGALVAQLFWSTLGWTCGAGPADFDPSEAESTFPRVFPADANVMCPIDGGTAP
jgi:hypothetical protein